MTDRNLDFRSDTLTQPTAAMRRAMAEAPVGDDVFDEDPTVQALERKVAELLGKEGALLVPSGTMSNQIGVRLHCGMGDEFLCEAGAHVINMEQAGHVQLSGVSGWPIAGDCGVLEPQQLASRIRPDDDHCARTRMVTLENTHNRAGGRILPYDTVAAVCRWAHEHGLSTHLDGARLFNAVTATQIPAAHWASHFDTVSVCFSKGLGAPVGSALAGSGDWIGRARRQRKVLGGGMRQAGIIAAGALYALEHHIERLADDHETAMRLGTRISAIDGLALTPAGVDTNIVMFDLSERLGSAGSLIEQLDSQGVKMLAISASRIRAVTCLNVNQSDVDRAAEILAAVVTKRGTRR
jgi:threonine aldolase